MLTQTYIADAQKSNDKLKRLLLWSVLSFLGTCFVDKNKKNLTEIWIQ